MPDIAPLQPAPAAYQRVPGLASPGVSRRHHLRLAVADPRREVLS